MRNVNPICNKIVFELLKIKFMLPFKFAHKPLCESFRNGTTKIFGLYICKGCLNIYLGIIGSFILSKFLITHMNEIYSLYFLVFSLFSFILSIPKYYYGFHHRLKYLLRFFCGLSIGLGFIFSYYYLLVGPLVLFIALNFLVFSKINRVKRKLNICEGCHENGKGICSGFQEQAQAFREMENQYYLKVLKYKGLQHD